MYLDELIEKLTQIKKCMGGHTEVSIWNDTTGDWMHITEINTTEDDEEEMVSGFVYFEVENDD